MKILTKVSTKMVDNGRFVNGPKRVLGNFNEELLITNNTVSVKEIGSKEFKQLLDENFVFTSKIKGIIDHDFSLKLSLFKEIFPEMENDYSLDDSEIILKFRKRGFQIVKLDYRTYLVLFNQGFTEESISKKDISLVIDYLKKELFFEITEHIRAIHYRPSVDSFDENGHRILYLSVIIYRADIICNFDYEPEEEVLELNKK